MKNQLNRNHIQAYSKLEIIARQVVEGFITGLHKSPFHGFSVEFAEHRLYNAGESTRHIDWKLFGKTDRLYVKRFEEETNLRCQIVIDHSLSMYFPFDNNGSFESPNKITFSVYAAAALIEILKRQRDAFGLTIFDQGIDQHSQTKSNEAHQQALFESLEDLLTQLKPTENQQSNITQSLHELAERIHKRSLVVIFSDMFDTSDRKDELFDALKHLKHNKHEVLLFHVMQHHSEIEFDYSNRPHKFIDPETGEILKINPSELRNQYRKLAKEQMQNLKLKCGQYKIDFVAVDIDQGFDEILRNYLLKRHRMI